MSGEADATGQALKEVRSFGTRTVDLLALSDWLAEADCSHVAMEGTGMYWKGHESCAYTGTG